MKSMTSELLEYFVIQKDKIKERSIEYLHADPFPHIVLDNFLPLSVAEKILDLFPDKDFEDFVRPEFGTNQVGKLGQVQKSYFLNIDPWLRYILYELNSMVFLDYLTNLTGYHGLIADPHYKGGAFHTILPGGKLDIHADFNTDKKRKLRRCLNVLIYFNKDWKDAYNGHLELWDKNMSKCVQRISPAFNTAVIFNTTSDSYHGHPKPLACPDDMTRKSIALYYYVATKEVFDVEDVKHSTLWQQPKSL